MIRPLLVLSAAAVLAAGAVTAAATAAPAAPRFASASAATVHPGVQTVTAGAQCTANFVFTDAAGSVLLGQSAHCAGTGGSTDTDGCATGSLPLGTPVSVQGASRPGKLVYSSWIAMNGAGEKDANTCAHNDFALVRLDPADVGRTNPSVPVFGGPTAVSFEATRVGAPVVSYGNSSLRFGLAVTSPKRGVSLGTGAGGWSHTVYTVSPGIPGDSGSGLLDASGRAFGTLSTVALLPYTGSNGVGDLAREVAYARSHGVAGLALVRGTEAFKGTSAR